MLSGEVTNTNFIAFGLTRSELEPTIYRTRGEYANHYTTDVVPRTRKHFVTMEWNEKIPSLKLIFLEIKTNKYFKYFVGNGIKWERYISYRWIS
jgi:hypothetical protein